MATSRISSNSPDWLDVVEVMAAFEQMNECVITLSGRVVDANGLRSLNLEFQAHEKTTEIGDRPSLASVRCQIGSHAHRTMESAVMWALYQLDWAIAKDTMSKIPKRP